MGYTVRTGSVAVMATAGLLFTGCSSEPAALPRADDAATEQARLEQDERSTQAAAERVRDATNYVKRIDPSTQLAQAAFDELKVFGDAITNGQEAYGTAQDYVPSFLSKVSTYQFILADRDPPDHLAPPLAELDGAIARFERAAQTLDSADADSTSQFATIYDDAVLFYNEALNAVYEGTNLVAPLV